MTHQICAALLTCTLLSACQPADETAPPPPEAGRASEAGPPMGDPADNPDMTGFAAEVDADGNGDLSRAEWTAQGLPVSSFNMFEKGRDFVTLDDYQQNAAPAGIDIDGDGKLTVAEFIAFDQQMAPQMGADGPLPPAE